MLGDKKFLRTIRVQNLLSFGPDTVELELRGLNVLIGANGVGKSNLIEVLSLLRAAPSDLLEPIRAGGGIAEWLWKGTDGAPIATVDLTATYPSGKMPLRHRISVAMDAQRTQLVDEAIENEKPSRLGDTVPYFYYRFQNGRPVLNVNAAQRELRREDLASDQSVISQRRDPDQYPELTYLATEYSKFKVFREWNLGRGAQVRRPQATDLESSYLHENAANLALVLNDLEHKPGLRRTLIEKLRDADGSITGFSTLVQGGTIQLFLHFENLSSPVAATRLSDGTLRYLCLLAILCHPTPPPLVCLEEPELGLHPDLLPGLADLLIEASDRMQLIVTTHSEVLVDSLTQVPESVVVCEKREGCTQLERLSRTELQNWLEDYGLGQLWRKGHIGGNRW